MTVGFGHGIAVTPLHLASGYATLLNGGVWRPATLLKHGKNNPVPAGRRVFSEDTSYKMRALLRLVVTHGTGRKADAPGYRVGGKTGSAEKYHNRSLLVTTFAGAFPMEDPRYVIVAMLDEPKGIKETHGFRTSGWNVAPVISKTVSRIAPVLAWCRTAAATPIWPKCFRTCGRRSEPMRLGDLAGLNDDRQVTGFAIDHRKVAPGTVFGAFQGTRFNGEDFVAQAVQSGAVAVVARPEAQVDGAAHLADPEPRRAFARLAAKFFAPFPARWSRSPGPTEKTSNVELTRQLWRMTGHHAASIGTLGVTTADDQVTTGLTTPDIVTFLSNMAGLAREGVTHAAFEARATAFRNTAPKGCRCMRRLSRTSAAIILIITARWRFISTPRCGCSTRCSSRTARRSSGPTIRSRTKWCGAAGRGTFGC
jgi:hypothetical protein